MKSVLLPQSQVFSTLCAQAAYKGNLSKKQERDCLPGPRPGL